MTTYNKYYIKKSDNSLAYLIEQTNDERESEYSVVHKFGASQAISTSFVPISQGNIYRTPQSGSATALRIKSGGNVADDPSGTGAHKVTLIGLNASWAEITEEITTAGTDSSSNTTNTFTRLYRAFVSESGTYATASAGSHAGDIVIENSAGTEDWATISATDFARSQTEIAVYTVATGKTAYIQNIIVSVDSQKVGSVEGFYREGADETEAPYTAMRTFVELGGISGEEVFTPEIPIGPFVGPCDIGFLGKVTSGTGEIDVDFELHIFG